MQERPTIFTVSRLNQEVRLLLEINLGNVWVEGEISNFMQPASGHWYFSIKDARAQVSCAMFKGQHNRLSYTPRDGDQVWLKARVSLYEPRGNYQLIVEKMEPAGDGALRQAFEALKLRLSSEGLFAEEHKKSFPALPQCIGVITSSTGAAIHDILTVLNRRFAAIPVIIYPTLVQGTGAAKTIAEAIALANHRNECDVLIVARGGGSLEDLWPFNEEIVARAIYASEIPIVSGVGHEVDVTIADFVADHRAPTPSAAAEFVSPDQREWRQAFVQLTARLQRTLQNTLRYKTQQLHLLQQRLQHPGHKLQQYAQTLDYLQTNLQKAMLALLKSSQQRLHGLARTLDAYSPLSTLGRGYAIVKKDSHIIRRSMDLQVGDKVTIQLHEGKAISQITRLEEN